MEKSEWIEDAVSKFRKRCEQLQEQLGNAAVLCLTWLMRRFLKSSIPCSGTFSSKLFRSTSTRNKSVPITAGETSVRKNEAQGLQVIRVHYACRQYKAGWDILSLWLLKQ